MPPDGGESLRYALLLTFKATNNKEKYEELITGLRLGKGINAVSLKVY